MIHSVKLRLKRFAWQLRLHPDEEFDPYADVYLSTNVSQQFFTLDLKGQASGEHVTEASSSILEFPLVTPCANEDELETLLARSYLNVDFYVHCHNSYNEVVTNPAGSSSLALQALLDMDEAAAAATGNIVMYQVHDPNLNIKGQYKIRITRDGGGAPVQRIAATEQRPTRRCQSECAQQEQWRSNAQKICGLYIEAVERWNDRIESTIEAVANINSSIWVSRAGIFPPLSFSLDACRPQISDAYLRHLVEIVLRRMRLTDEQALALADDSDQLAQLAGQTLCVPITHTIYRSDFVYAYNQSTGKVEKVETENFGDVSVDHFSGDCEDLGKFILRLDAAFLRIETTHADALVRKLASYLRCFMPLLVLLGVSSAQINAAPSDIVEMVRRLAL